MGYFLKVILELLLKGKGKKKKKKKKKKDLRIRPCSRWISFHAHAGGRDENSLLLRRGGRDL